MEEKNFDETSETSEVTTETAQIDGISADNDTCTNSSTADESAAESTTESVQADSDTEIAPVEHKKRNKKKVGNEKPADDSEIAAQVAEMAGFCCLMGKIFKFCLFVYFRLTLIHLKFY